MKARLTVWVCSCLLAIGSAASQDSAVPPTSKPGELRARAAFRHLRDGEVPKAIALMKEAFDLSDDRKFKQDIAFRLVMHADKNEDQPYFDYLMEAAQGAVDEGADIPCLVESQEADAEYSEAFVRYASQEKLTANALYDLVMQQSRDLGRLARTGEPRGFDLLLRALASSNCVLSSQAVKGLGLIGDQRAVAPLIAAGLAYPASSSGRRRIAGYLVYIDDPEAQAKAREWVGNDEHFRSLQESARAIKEKRRHAAVD